MRADRLKKGMVAISAAVMIAILYFVSSALRANSASRYSQSIGYLMETRPANCAPIPRDTDLPYTRTPTPNLQTQQSPNFGADYTPGPTVTPIPFARIVDLDPDALMKDKAEVIVFRCDGSFEQWWLGPDHYNVEIPLEPGDVILGSAPPASLMGPPPTVTDYWKNTSTPLSLPPYPLSPPASDTPSPYPAP